MPIVILSTEEDEDDEDEGSEEDELSEVEDVFFGDEAELPKKIAMDMRPSKGEVESHNKNHLPYRSWRPHCV